MGRYNKTDIKKIHKKYGKKNKGFFIILLFFLMIISVTIFVFYNQQKSELDNTFKKSYKQVENKTSKIHENLDNVSILLIGVDNNSERNLDNARADTMIYLTYNSEKSKFISTSIPRDIYIEQDDYTGKLNGAYSHGEEKSTIEAVENVVQSPIDYYATIDFNGLENVVNDIGGIDINSKISIDKSNNESVGKDINIKKGNNHLDGKHALAYARMRKIDNDIQRGERQQQVVKAILQQLTKEKNINDYQNKAKTLMSFVQTNIKLNDVLSHINPKLKNLDVETSTYKWTDENKNGVSYVQISPEEKQKISNIHRENLDMRTLPIEYFEDRKVDIDE